MFKSCNKSIKNAARKIQQHIVNLELRTGVIASIKSRNINIYLFTPLLISGERLDGVALVSCTVDSNG